MKMIETFNIFLSAPIGLQVIILGVPISFYLVGSWLHDGYKQDQEIKKQERLDKIKWTKKTQQ
jgi:hypothetical protein